MRSLVVAASGGVVAVAGLPLVVLGLAVATLAGPGGGGPAEGGSAGGGQAGTPASTPSSVPGIPADYLADFERSADRFGVPWDVLAGIYYEECDFGQSRLSGCSPRGTENGAGAQGPGQFLAPTWRRGLGAGQLIPPGPPTLDIDDGCATDGDGDGVADPWDPADAVASTARLLAANGAASGNVPGAVFAYNHAQSYVAAVLARAALYDEEAGSTPTGGPAGPSGPDPEAGTVAPGGPGPVPVGTGDPSAVAAVLAFAESQLGRPYQWGGAGPTSWDCSGLVQAAYGRVGVAFTHNAAAQYQATAGDAVPLGEPLEAGDLVFFGPSLPGIEHVGIVVGNGLMIDAPHTGAVVRVESYDWSDLIAATRPL